MPDKKDETAVWDYESKEKKKPKIDQEKIDKLVEQHWARKKAHPNYERDQAVQQQIRDYDAVQKGYTDKVEKLKGGVNRELDAWMDMPSSNDFTQSYIKPALASGISTGVEMAPDSPEDAAFSLLTGPLGRGAGMVRNAARAKRAESIDDIVRGMGYKGKTGPINEALRERRLADDIVRADRKVVGDPDLLDDFPGLKENSKKYKRADEVADADFEKTLQAGEEAIAENPGLFKDMTDAEMKGSAEFLRAKPFSPNREELTLYYKLLEIGKTPQQAQLTLQNRRLMQP